MGMEISKNFGNSGNGNEIRGNGNSHGLAISDYKQFIINQYGNDLFSMKYLPFCSEVCINFIKQFYTNAVILKKNNILFMRYVGDSSM